MRLVVLGLSLALAGSAPLTFAVAQSPVTTQPLAAGEVLLEVNALGMVTNRADSASLSVTVGGSGETEAAARTATDAKIREIRGVLRGLGIADADIRVRPVTTSTEPPAPSLGMGYSDTNAVAEYENLAMPAEEGNATYPLAEEPPSPAAYGQAAMEIIVRDVDRVTAVQRVLVERGIFGMGLSLPTYQLADGSAARRAARAQAMQKARSDAEGYAAALNMRVARIVRVTERIGLEGLGLFVSEAQSMTRLFVPRMFTGVDVTTVAAVGVDFALVPR